MSLRLLCLLTLLGAASATAQEQPQLRFMSDEHVRQMNSLLAESAEVAAAVEALDQRYILAYELDDGPQGETVWWQMIFDPVSGLRFSLDAPESPPSITFRGDYSAMIRATRAMAGGQQVDMPLEADGDDSVMTTIGEAFAAGQQAAGLKTRFPDVDVVVLETSYGNVEIELFPYQAPLSTANFVAYVDGGHYDGSLIYRATVRPDDVSEFEKLSIVQGGLLAEKYTTAIAEGKAAELTLDSVLPPIDHETTDQTGIKNEYGVLSWGRLDPGTATSEWFINMDANPSLDSGFEGENRDGYGYATFGRVTSGIDVLRTIQGQPKGEGATQEILLEPVEISRAYRKYRLQPAR